MTAEAALALEYPEQPHPPRRPSPYDDAIRDVTVRAVAKDVADWLEEDISDELIEILSETMPYSGHIDGFKWAVKLRDKYQFDGDSALVEILDGAALWSTLRGAVIGWVEANKITAKFAVGDRVLVDQQGPGTITRINADTAEYVVRTENREWSDTQFGYLIPFERCSEVTDG